MADTVAYVRAVEQLRDRRARRPRARRVRAGSHDYPGVWVEPDGRRPARSPPSACGCRRGRSMHGFALNVDPDLRMFDHIVPCGIADKAVTSLAAEGVDVDDAPRSSTPWPRRARRARGGAPATSGPTSSGATAPTTWRRSPGARARATPVRSASSRRRRAHADGGASVRLRAGCAEAGVTDGLADRQPQARVDAGQGPHSATEYRDCKRDHARPRPRHRVRGGRLPQPLRVLGRRHGHVHDQRRALHPGLRVLPGRHPPPRSRSTPTSPTGSPRPSSAWACASPCVTTVARDDLRRRRRRARSPRPSRPSAAARPGMPGRGADPRLQGRRRRARPRSSRPRPDVLNHNIETVARLQRAVRPSAGYARSLAVLARAKAAGLTTKSGHHRRAWARPTTRSSQTLADLAGGRRRHRHHRPVPAPHHRTTCRSPAGWTPEEFDALRPHRRGRWASPTSRPARSPGQLPRPPGRAAATAPLGDPLERGVGMTDDGRLSAVGRTAPGKTAGADHSSGFVDAAPVLRGHRADRRRRPRQPLAQGRRHVPGARRAHRSPTSTSPAAASRPIAHLRENGRMTVHVLRRSRASPQHRAASTARGRVRARPATTASTSWSPVARPRRALAQRHPWSTSTGSRRRVATRCPFMATSSERAHASTDVVPSARSPEELVDYRAQKNAARIDGLPGLNGTDLSSNLAAVRSPTGYAGRLDRVRTGDGRAGRRRRAAVGRAPTCPG